MALFGFKTQDEELMHPALRMSEANSLGDCTQSRQPPPKFQANKYRVACSCKWPTLQESVSQASGISVLIVTLPTTARQVASDELWQDSLCGCGSQRPQQQQRSLRIVPRQGHPPHSANPFSLLRPGPAGCRPACPVPLQSDSSP